MKYREWANRTVRQANVLHNRQCAVLVPIIELNDEQQVVFEVRNSNLEWQPGDICFPGGTMEIGDRSAQAAAVRETKEELGVSDEQIHLLGPLDYIESPVGVTVWPFAAVLDTADFQVNQAEVSEIFTVPVSWFLHHEPEQADMEIATRPAASFPRDVKVPSPVWMPHRTYDIFIYRYGTKTIWGITAHIVKDFIAEFKRLEKE